MPQSSSPGNEPSTHMQAMCPDHGLIGIGPLNIVTEQVGSHFATHHPGLHVVREGEHFTIEASPTRCDLCGTVMEPPWWMHELTAPLLELGDGDGLWAVCDPCHDLAARGAIKEMIQRHYAELRNQGVTTSRQEVALLSFPRYSGFIERADAGERVYL